MSAHLRLVGELISAVQAPHASASVLPPLPPLPAVGPSVPLTGAVPTDTDLLEVLRQRVAVRAWSDTALDLADLGAAAVAGLLADRDSWSPAEHGALDVVVVALRVAGLERGMYRLDEDLRSLTPVATLPADVADDLTLQREFADAAAIVAVLGDLEATVARHGEHGYRLLMTRAGAACYTTWLHAIGLGFAGTVFAGFIPAAVRTRLRCDGVRRHPLFAVALGEPTATGAATARG